MEAVLQQFYADGTLLILWGGLLFHFIIPIPEQAHPMVLWRKFAEILSNKVNTGHSFQQSSLSGYLAMLLMLIPAIIVLIALEPLVWRPELYHLALLILALGWRSQYSLIKSLTQALAIEDKPAARRSLGTIVNRKTETLSLVGLGKTAAETQIIGHSRTVIGVLFWYGVAGGIGAFSFRLLVELHRAWSPSRKQYYPFGNATAILLLIAEYIPLQLYALILLLGKAGISQYHLIHQQSKNWRSPTTGRLIATIGCKLNLSLGGPAIYGETKTLRAKLGGRVVPSAIHLVQITKQLTITTLVWIAFESIILLFLYQGL